MLNSEIIQKFREKVQDTGALIQRRGTKDEWTQKMQKLFEASFADFAKSDDVFYAEWFDRLNLEMNKFGSQHRLFSQLSKRKDRFNLEETDAIRLPDGDAGQHTRGVVEQVLMKVYKVDIQTEFVKSDSFAGRYQRWVKPDDFCRVLEQLGIISIRSKEDIKLVLDEYGRVDHTAVSKELDQERKQKLGKGGHPGQKSGGGEIEDEKAVRDLM